LLELVQEGRGDLIFANLLDFDQTYGHVMMPPAMLPPWKNLTGVWKAAGIPGAERFTVYYR
jgi:hypothetical protein